MLGPMSEMRSKVIGARGDGMPLLPARKESKDLVTKELVATQKRRSGSCVVSQREMEEKKWDSARGKEKLSGKKAAPHSKLPALGTYWRQIAETMRLIQMGISAPPRIADLESGEEAMKKGERRRYESWSCCSRRRCRRCPSLAPRS